MSTITLPQVQRLFITRQQYDQHILNTFWMHKHWFKLDRQWSLGGVSVTGPIERISELESILGLKVR